MLSALTKIGAGLALALLAAEPAAGQPEEADYPTRTVKVVVPYASGGITDTMARVTGDRLGKMLGQSFYMGSNGMGSTADERSGGGG